jgi:hypothetical protein
LADLREKFSACATVLEAKNYRAGPYEAKSTKQNLGAEFGSRIWEQNLGAEFVEQNL